MKQSLSLGQTSDKIIDWLINPLLCSFDIADLVALDRNLEPSYNTLSLRMIPVALLSACPHGQFHPEPCLLDSRAAKSNSIPSKQGGILFHWYDSPGTRTRVRGGHAKH